MKILKEKRKRERESNNQKRMKEIFKNKDGNNEK